VENETIYIDLLLLSQYMSALSLPVFYCRLKTYFMYTVIYGHVNRSYLLTSLLTHLKRVLRQYFHCLGVGHEGCCLGYLCLGRGLFLLPCLETNKTVQQTRDFCHTSSVSQNVASWAFLINTKVRLLQCRLSGEHLSVVDTLDVSWCYHFWWPPLASLSSQYFCQHNTS